MNVFTNLLLAIVILLSKLVEFFIMFISRKNTFLRFSLNIYFTFQSCRTILLLKTEVSFLTNSICVFPVLTIIVLNFSTANIQTNCFKSISQKFGKILNSFPLIFLILVIWQFNYFAFLHSAFIISVIFTMVITLICILLQH